MTPKWMTARSTMAVLDPFVSFSEHSTRWLLYLPILFLLNLRHLLNLLHRISLEVRWYEILLGLKLLSVEQARHRVILRNTLISILIVELLDLESALTGDTLSMLYLIQLTVLIFSFVLLLHLLIAMHHVRPKVCLWQLLWNRLRRWIIIIVVEIRLKLLRFLRWKLELFWLI